MGKARMADYFSDRENGATPRTEEVIPPLVWAGLVALINTLVKDGAFGFRFPDTCHDGNDVCGVDEHSLKQVFDAQMKGLTWPLATTSTTEVSELSWRTSEQKEPFAPETLLALDVLEFVHNSIAKPIREDYHNFFRHYHLAFDEREGRAQFRDDVNLIFRRNNLAYEFEANGKIKRTLPPVLGQALSKAQFDSGDSTLDKMLAESCEKYSNPDPVIRREAIERLWDAWERLKTLKDDTNKKLSIKKILDMTASEPAFREQLEEEAKTLTTMGNTLHIRHSERTQCRVSDPQHIDYLFHRLFSMILLLLNKI